MSEPQKLDPIEEAFSRATFATPDDQQVVLDAIADLFDLRRGRRMIAVDHLPGYAGGVTVRLIEGGVTRSVYLLGASPNQDILAWLVGNKNESEVAEAFDDMLRRPRLDGPRPLTEKQLEALVMGGQCESPVAEEPVTEEGEEPVLVPSRNE